MILSFLGSDFPNSQRYQNFNWQGPILNSTWHPNLTFQFTSTLPYVRNKHESKTMVNRLWYSEIMLNFGANASTVIQVHLCSSILCTFRHLSRFSHYLYHVWCSIIINLYCLWTELTVLLLHVLCLSLLYLVWINGFKIYLQLSNHFNYTLKNEVWSIYHYLFVWLPICS